VLDGGQSWAPAELWGLLRELGGANACDLNKLVALSQTEIILVAEGAPNPICLPSDGGRAWAPVVLLEPAAEDGWSPMHGLQMLPDGSLIGRQQGNASRTLLAPQATGWCDVPPTVLGATFDAAETAMLIGERLCWLAPPGAPVQAVSGAPVPASAPLVSIPCAASARTHGPVSAGTLPRVSR